MAKIRKRVWTNKNGEQEAWIIDYKDQHNKRHIETFKTRKLADARRKEIEAEVDKGVHTPAHASPTVAEAGEAWIRQAEVVDGLERSTIRQYRQHLDLHIKPFLGGKKLAQLTVPNVKKFRSDLIEAGRSPGMAKRVITSLGAILGEAQSSGQVSRNVVREEIIENASHTKRRRRVEKRNEKAIKEGVDFPTKDELKRMLAVEHRCHALVVTVVFSGLRASELRGLTWDCVDLDRGIIRVEKRADRWNQMGAPKSRSARREVKIPPYAVNTLRRWREWRLMWDGVPNLVFPNRHGGTADHQSLHRHGLGPLLVAAGLGTDPREPRYGLHSLRHAAASLWIEQGFTPKRVQALMGHSTIAMTLDTYTHLWQSPDDDEKAMQKMQERLRLVG